MSLLGCLQYRYILIPKNPLVSENTHFIESFIKNNFLYGQIYMFFNN